MKKILLFIFFVFLFFLSPLKSFAYVPIGAGLDCNEDSECLSQYGAGKCVGQMCVDMVLSFQDKFEQEIEQCKNGDMNLSCFIGGTEAISDDGYSGVVGAILSTALIGINGPSYKTSINNPSKTKVQGGAIGGVASVIGTMYAHPPATSGQYASYLAERIGVVKPAYAQQGVGFEGLRPILDIWKTFRNAAYILMVFAFIGIGFAIMFRVKLDPKTVITIQNAIPRFVIGLILITFSYAIAGLLIDLMRVISAIVFEIINPHYLFRDFGKFLEDAGIIGEGVANFGKNPGLITFLFIYLKNGLDYANIITRIMDPMALIAEIANVPNVIIKAFSMISPTSLPGKVFSFIFSLALLFAFLKLAWELLKAYIMIIVGIIFSPIMIVMGIFPGKNQFAWIKGLIANMAIFPAVLAFLAVSSRLIVSAQGGQLWMPAPIHIFGIGSPGRIVAAIIAYGLLLLAPAVPNMVKDAFGIRPTKYGAIALEPYGKTIQAGYRAGASAVVSKLEDSSEPDWAAAVSAVTGVRGRTGGGKGTAPGTATGSEA
ncbi:hypothetical protein KKA69_01740 [Patescibacteria group bacterium]|nr:hypothetical protein [Patescibacteria group bacterium]